MNIVLIILQLLPLIFKLIGLFKSSPAEVRDKMIVDLHAAFNKAKETNGDTSAIEEIIKKGKQ